MNNELGRTWKKAALPNLRNYCSIFMESQRKTRKVGKTSVKLAGVWIEVWI
jgi:hypothetical protein